MQRLQTGQLKYLDKGMLVQQNTDQVYCPEKC